MKRFGLELLWIGGRPGMTLAATPTYYLLAGIHRGAIL
jgi:hypothetical protein